MELQIVATGSNGNCYLLRNESEALLIECGVRFFDLKKAVRHDLGLIVGAIVTHEHQDHSLSIKDLIHNGIDTYASSGTFESLKISPPKGNILKHNEKRKIGGFSIIPFKVIHDAKEPLGFLIHHEDCGKVLFLTDSSMIPYKFPNLNNIIIEANYCEEILKEKESKGMFFLAKRIINSHLSIQSCLKFLTFQDLTNVNNIVLIHLSDRNSNENEFYNKTQSATLKNVTVANNNQIITFDKTPF